MNHKGDAFTGIAFFLEESADKNKEDSGKTLWKRPNTGA
jgi:hypothetical protein